MRRTVVRKRAFYSGLASVAVLLFFLTGCGGGGAEGDGGSGATWDRGSGEPEVLAVQALEVSRGTFVDQIEISGLISGASEADVVSETSGVIRGVEFDLGQEIARGDVLLRLDDTIERLAMEEARSQAETADLELAAAERLFESGNASQADVARARSAAAGAESRYQRALKTYQDQTIRAPISGAVATRDPGVTEGNFLNRGIVVARIVDIERFQLAGAVGEREVRYLRPGLPAEIEIAACPGAAPEARVTAVAAGSDPRTGSFPVIVEWENTCDEPVRSGMTARALIQPAGAEEVMVIPSSVVLRRGDESVVFIAQEGTALQQSVQIGRRVGGKVEVVSGLALGDLVITSGLGALEDEDPVEVTVTGATGDLL
jgi:membrane fusion protein, multidrug efflux system